MRIKAIRPASKQNTAPDFQEWSIKVAKSYASPGTEIDVAFLDAGPNVGPMVGHINEARIQSSAPFLIQQVIRAEEEGYDAVWTTGEYDVGVEIARHLVKIPVIDSGLTPLHVATLLGDRICLLIIEDSVRTYARKLLKRWGMTDFVTSIKAWNISVGEAWDRKSEIKDKTLSICKQAIKEEDAQVILPFCAVFIPFILTAEEIEAELDVPVIDPGAVCVKMAEMFVNLDIHRSQKAYPFTPQGKLLFQYAQASAIGVE